MKRHIASQLIRIARRLDPPSSKRSTTGDIVLNVAHAELALAEVRRQAAYARQGQR